MSVPQVYTVGYVPSSLKVVEKMLCLAGVKTTDVVYDLGCGDGRVVITAVRDFGAKKGVGIEIRRDLVDKAREAVFESGLVGRVEIVHMDIFGVNIGDADVVVLYLSPTANEMLRLKLERELRDGARVVAHSFPVKGWPPKREEIIPGARLYLYRIKKG